MRRASRLRIAGPAAAASLAFAACGAVGAPTAQAWTQSARAAGDPQTTWTVTQNSITVRSTDPVLLSFVRGSHVLLGCNSSQSRAPRRPPPIVFWRRTASAITARVTEPIGRHVSVCDAVEVGDVHEFPTATVFSRAPFDARWRTELAGTPPPGRLLAHAQLSEYWGRVDAVVGPRFLNRFGFVVRLPPVPALARQLSGRTGPVRYTPTLAGVTVPRVVYVIGRGSSRKQLELAVIGFDGKLYTLRTTVGANSHPKFGTG